MGMTHIEMQAAQAQISQAKSLERIAYALEKTAEIQEQMQALYLAAEFGGANPLTTLAKGYGDE
jgi:hypothetical protein